MRSKRFFVIPDLDQDVWWKAKKAFKVSVSIRFALISSHSYTWARSTQRWNWAFYGSFSKSSFLFRATLSAWDRAQFHQGYSTEKSYEAENRRNSSQDLRAGDSDRKYRENECFLVLLGDDVGEYVLRRNHGKHTKSVLWFSIPLKYIYVLFCCKKYIDIQSRHKTPLEQLAKQPNERKITEWKRIMTSASIQYNQSQNYHWRRPMKVQLQGTVIADITKKWNLSSLQNCESRKAQCS